MKADMDSRNHIYETSDQSAWAHRVREVFGGLEVAISKPEKFHGIIETYCYDEFTVAYVTSNYLKVWHNGTIGSLSKSERFLIKTQVKGHSLFSIGTQDVRLNEGEFIICDNARAYTFEFSDTTEIITIPIPKKFIGRFFAHPEDIAFKICPRLNDLAGITVAFLLSVWQRRGQNSLHQYEQELLNTYFELLVLSFESRYGAEKSNLSEVQTRHLNRCITFIENNLGRMDLSPTLLSKEMNLSIRYIASLFANRGETIGRYILSCRLDSSAQMLRSKRFTGKTIAEFGYMCGFKSSAHFSRTFKERFAESPKDYRARSYTY